MWITLTLGLLAPQQIVLPQSMDLALHDLPRTYSILPPSGSRRATIACDDLNRPDGPVGPGWIQMVGTVILGSAVWNSNGRNGWMRHTSATAAHLSAVIELDLLPNRTGSSRSSALIMGESFLTGDSIDVAIQNQIGLAGYSHYAFDRTLLGSSAGGCGGFFAVGFELDATNDGLHVRVRHDAAGVTSSRSTTTWTDSTSIPSTPEHLLPTPAIHSAPAAATVRGERARLTIGS